MRADRRDANEALIVAYWRQAGCIWIPMHPGQGFDGLLIDFSGLYIVEIKNPKTASHLTKCERALQDAIQEIGGAYNVVSTLHEAAALIGLAVQE